MKRYCLLTGSTGLLGSYLMRDCLRRGFPLAVLARKSRMQSPRGRVETILARWEGEMGCRLPRPVVLEGDICEQGLALDADSRKWVQQHCHSILHSAASLTFEPNAPNNEPWRSNLEGTRQVLNFARSVGIRQFHHVSTAYLCGIRDTTAYEHELDTGHPLRNVYEESKLAAEKLVRETPDLDRVTIYRPAIIVGDSQTGYTTTYHGFYAPLKIVHALVGLVPRSELDVTPLLHALGMTGQERKNFVPVDWVSAVMTHILTHESLHGQTYHITPRHRVSVADMTEVLTEVVLDLCLPPASSSASAPESSAGVPPAVQDISQGTSEAPERTLDLADFEETFRTQMQIYESHWSDDPVFDASNTAKAAPHLPSPEVDRAMIRRLAVYALEHKFGWPVPPPIRPQVDVQACLTEQISDDPNRAPHRAADDGPSGELHQLVLEVSGPGGGEWTLDFQAGQLIRFTPGRDGEALPHAYMSSSTYRQLAESELTSGEALRGGALILSAGESSLEPLLQAIDRLAVIPAVGQSTPAASSSRSLAG